MAEDHNISDKEHSAKHPTTSGATAEGRSPHSATQPKRCTHGPNSRNLIVCIDGTANQFGEKNTNVIELYNLILKEDEHNQRTWYNSGIGTYARPSWKSFKFYRQALSHKIDLAIAWKFERTILAAYRWLSDNYQSGDCIYLFGFSRGAYQVRVLSAMIDKVGLIYKGNETQIPFAYELYSDPESHSHKVARVGSSPKQDENKMSMAERFKKAFSYKDVTVHFVGAWDTVSSIGIARSKGILPGTIDGMKHVCYFRHALALDERRVKFLPEYAYGGTTMPPGATDNASPINDESQRKDSDPPGANGNRPIANSEPSDKIPPVDNEPMGGPSQARMKPTGDPPHTMEVWFAGTHSDIGGGNVVNAGMDRSRPPLRWMVFQAGALGLRTAPFERDLSPDQQIEIKESLTWFWWPLELFPFKRLTYASSEDGEKNTYKPHLGSSRKIHRGQKIHGSLVLSDNKNYTPKACPLYDGPSFWKDARTKGLGDRLELDLYEYTQTLVKNVISEPSGAALQNLQQTATWADGLQAVYDAVIRALSGLDPDAKLRLLESTVDIIGRGVRGSTPLQQSDSAKIHALVSDIPKTTQNQKVVQQFLCQFVYGCILIVARHTDRVGSVAFSPDGGWIVSGSADNTVRIWDVETAEPVGEPFQGHTDDVLSIAFSPDGKRIVSGSADKAVRIWDAETGKSLGELFREHTDWVRSVAFSPDGKRVVSGSADKTIRIWDVELGKLVGKPFEGHTNGVLSVAFSPDGRRIVSSDDKTIRIWDAETGKPVGNPFRGHASSISSVAFSPDGKRIVGSDDITVWIWDVETGKLAGKPFRGHASSVSSVALSPDGGTVVLGSMDGTVQIWNAETGKPVGRPFRGHASLVSSVAFSPDGRRIVSGSYDKAIRIWDVEAAEIDATRILDVEAAELDRIRIWAAKARGVRRGGSDPWNPLRLLSMAAGDIETGDPPVELEQTVKYRTELLRRESSKFNTGQLGIRVLDQFSLNVAGRPVAWGAQEAPSVYGGQNGS